MENNDSRIYRLAKLSAESGGEFGQTIASAGMREFGEYAWTEASVAAVIAYEAAKAAEQARLRMEADRADIRNGILCGGCSSKPFTTWVNGGAEEPSFAQLWMPVGDEAFPWICCSDAGGEFEYELASSEEALEAFDADGAACPFIIG